MDKQETREKIITTVKEAIGNNASFEGEMLVLGSNDVDHIAEESADELVSKGYINGADFVEWLKESKYAKSYNTDIDYHECECIEVGMLDRALQEYLGERG